MESSIRKMDIGESPIQRMNKTTEVYSDELNKYNQLYAEKEKELKAINIQRIANLETSLKLKNQQIQKISAQLTQQIELSQNYQLQANNANNQLQDYNKKMEQIKQILLQKNNTIQLLQDKINVANSQNQQNIQKQKNKEQTLLEQCDLLKQQIKEHKWKFDQLQRESSAQINLIKSQLDSSAKLNENMLSEERQTLQDSFKKILEDKEQELLKIKNDSYSHVQALENSQVKLQIQLTDGNKRNEEYRQQIILLNKQNAELQQKYELRDIELNRKNNELQNKLSLLEKEKEFAQQTQNSVSQELNRRLEQLLMEKQVIEVDLKTLQNKYQIDLQTKEETKKIEIERLTNKLNLSIEKLQEQISIKDKEIDRLTLEIQDLKIIRSELDKKTQVNEANQELVHNRQIENLKSHISQLKEQITSKNNDIQRIKDQTENLETIIQTKNEEIKKLKRHIESIQENCEELKNDYFKIKANKKREIQEAQNSIEDKYSLQISQLKSKSNQQTLSIENLTQENETLLKENSQLKQQLTSRINHLQHSIKDDINKLKSIKKTAPLIPFLNEEYQVDQQQEIWKNEIESIENWMKDSIPPTNNQPLRLKKELDEKKIRILELENENSELKSVIEEMRLEMESVKNNIERIEPNDVHSKAPYFDVVHFETKIKQSNLELENYQLKYEDSINQIRNLKRELQYKEDKVFEIENKVLQKENDLLALKQKLISYENTIRKLKSERDKLIEISNNLRVEINSVQRKNEITTFQKMKKESDKQISYSDQYQTAEIQTSPFKENVEKKWENIKEMAKKNELLSLQNAELSEQIAEQNSKIISLNQKIFSFDQNADNTNKNNEFESIKPEKDFSQNEELLVQKEKDQNKIKKEAVEPSPFRASPFRKKFKEKLEALKHNYCHLSSSNDENMF